MRKTSAGSYTIEYHPVVSFDTVWTTGAQPTLRAAFFGETSVESEPGTPIVSYRGFSLLFPSAQVSINLLESEYSDVVGVVAATVPSFEPDGEFGMVRVPTAPEETYGTQDVTPTNIVSIHDVAPHGQEYTGTIRLYPVQVNASTQKMRVYSKLVVEVRAVPALTKAPPTGVLADSPLSQGEWYRMDVNQTGVQKLDWQFFSNAGIAPTTVGNIQSIRIFGRTGMPLSEDVNAAAANPIAEIPRLIVDSDNDGALGQGDYVLFFGQAASDWRYDSTASISRHFVNPFTRVNSYLMTFGGVDGRSMMAIPSGNDPSSFGAPDVESRLFVENDREILVLSGQQWVGEMLNSESRSFVFSNALPGYVQGSTIRYKVVLLSRSAQRETFLLEENNQFIGRIATSGVDVSQNNVSGLYAYKTPITTLSYSGAISGERSNLRITYESVSVAAQGWIDWVEIFYRRRLVASGDVIRFDSRDTTASVEYRLESFSPARDVRVFDITDHDDVAVITGIVYDPADPTKATFERSEVASQRREYLAVGPGGYRIPASATKLPNSNLLGMATGADFVIVSPLEFVSQAQRLAAHRQQRDTLTTLVVPFEHIANEFAHGIPDPTALRNFLLHARATWQRPPRYVLLFGDGHYDYRGISTGDRNWIPPYESVESVLQIATYTSDDYFVLLDPSNPRISLPIGRFPVNSPQEAEIVVDKEIAYETSAPYDPWRNRITYVADDGLTSTGNDGNIHTAQAEVLAQVYTPNSIQKKKIYIVEYPTVNSASGRRKPAANEAIIRAINEGSVITNYTGHGNPKLWAHENIFNLEQSIPQLYNTDRLTFVVAATCDFARYDNPAEVSSGEELILRVEGGAIGVLTASRAVYSYQNSQFNNAFYAEVFQRGSDGQYARLGDAMYRTKQIYYDTNALKFHLFADPTMRLAVPAMIASVDSVDGSSTAAQIQVRSLSKPVVKGEIRRADNSRWAGFNGRVDLEVYDSKRRVYVPEWNNYSFEINGSILYRGELTVNDGYYQAVIPIPKDVSYDNSAARIAAYGWGNQVDASGFTENILIAGTDTTAPIDTSGPILSIYLEDESFRSGEVVPPNPVLLVRLSDENGINTSTASIGHRLEARLSGQSQPIDLSEYYRGDLDTYQSGSIQYQLADVEEGRHTVSVKAWDTYNNSAEATVEFEVRSAAGEGIDHVMNFPNPFSRSTAFTFQRPSTDPIDVEIRIYTVAGRRVHRINVPSVIDRFVQIDWNGRDRDGNELANGVYFYKVIVRSLTTGETEEVIKKLAVLR